MKTADQILTEHQLSPEDMAHYKIWDYVIKAMKAYASQFIDEAANKYIPDGNPKIFRDKILKLKQDLK